MTGVLMDSSQIDFVGEYIKRHKKGITSMEAFGFGITRLSAVIYILRDRGYQIESEWHTCKNRYGHTARYVRYVYRGGGK